MIIEMFHLEVFHSVFLLAPRLAELIPHSVSVNFKRSTGEMQAIIT